jgi:hypothetical protein
MVQATGFFKFEIFLGGIHLDCAYPVSPVPFSLHDSLFFHCTLKISNGINHGLLCIFWAFLCTCLSSSLFCRTVKLNLLCLHSTSGGNLEQFWLIHLLIFCVSQRPLHPFHSYIFDGISLWINSSSDSPVPDIPIFYQYSYRRKTIHHPRWP